MRRHPRCERSTSRLPLWVLAAGVFGVLVFGLTPAGLATTGQFDRDATADVVMDDNGVLALDVAPSVRKNQVDPLVNVTNNYGVAVSVTVALQDGSDGDLYLDGANVGDQATFTLSAGTVQTVDIMVDTPPGSTVSFDVTGSGTDLEVTALNRETTAESSGGGGPPGA